MRRLALAIVVACMLSGVARAGEIHPTGVVPPPPNTAMTTTAIPGTDATAPQASSKLLTIILTLIRIGR